VNQEEFIEQVRSVVTDGSLTPHLRKHYLAGLAENALPYPDISHACAAALNKGIISNLFEGHAPCHPRCLPPDYARALAQGSDHLELDSPSRESYASNDSRKVPNATEARSWLQDPSPTRT
jgi:hypothetical protein